MTRGLEHLSQQEMRGPGLSAAPAAGLCSTTRALSTEKDKPAGVCFGNERPCRHRRAGCVEPAPVAMAMAAQTTLTDLRQLLPSAPSETANPAGSGIPGCTGETQQSLFPRAQPTF